MLPKSIFGRYIPRAALEHLRHYSYKGSGSTPIDRFLNPWWEWVASKLPLWICPNVLTLLGFLCTVISMGAVVAYMPHLEEAAPRIIYYGIALLIFIYQIFIIFINWGVVRMGLGLYSYMLLAIVQMHLMVYTTIGMSLLAGIFGPDVFLLKVSQIIPSPLRKLAAELVPTWLLQQRFQTVVSFPFYILLIYLLVSDIINGCCVVPNRMTAWAQLAGCFGHILFQFAFYSSDLLVSHPATSYALIIMNSSIVALRMSVAAACKWPAIPFYIAAVYFYCAVPRADSPLAWLVDSPLSLKQQHQQQQIAPWILQALALWSAFYLYDFVTSTVSAICTYLNISCFHIDKQELSGPHERLEHRKQDNSSSDGAAPGAASTGIKRRPAAPPLVC